MPEETNTDERAREARARRKARAQGLVLRKSRIRNRNVDNWGGYMLVDAQGNYVVRGERWNLDLDDVEKFLSE